MTTTTTITTTSRTPENGGALLRNNDEHDDYGAQDAIMNEMIAKHRTELTELQQYIGHAVNQTGDDDDELLFPNDHLPPPPPPLSDRDVGESSGPPRIVDANESYDNIPSPDGFNTPRPVRSKTAERLMELSRNEEAQRNDRMKLAELSDVRNERIGRDVIRRWNPDAKVVRNSANRSFKHVSGRTSPTVRVRKITTTTSPRTSAKVLREYSKDFVQQALDFNSHDVDDDDDELHLGGRSPTTRGLNTDLKLLSDGSGGDGGGFRGQSSQQELRTYVKQMEETIAQLVLQKDELLRNQAEFDKHASGIFPSLEHLNHQLSQIVQGKMANSQVNIKEDMYDEMRILGEKLDELESETKRRSHDTDVLEQNRQIEITQIKGQIVSLVTSGKLRDEKTELIADTVKKLQQELQEAVKGVLHRYQLIEKRVSQLQTPLMQPRLVSRRLPQRYVYFIAAIAVAVLTFLFATFGNLNSNCGLFRRCTPLT
uniref:Uncharacterized protein n=1 Tax=Globisporangium ultimum (strain ATCC 200006 / CBS 805.95 / DAOM BR144) TaxID=431595 RepID=K3WKS9_GLOUD